MHDKKSLILALYYGWVWKPLHVCYDTLKWHGPRHVSLHVIVYYTVPRSKCGTSHVRRCYVVTWNKASWHHMLCSAMNTCAVHHMSSYFTCGQRWLDRHTSHHDGHQARERQINKSNINHDRHMVNRSFIHVTCIARIT